jgi:hypothetical protein
MESSKHGSHTLVRQYITAAAFVETLLSLRLIFYPKQTFLVLTVMAFLHLKQALVLLCLSMTLGGSAAPTADTLAVIPVNSMYAIYFVSFCLNWINSVRARQRTRSEYVPDETAVHHMPKRHWPSDFWDQLSGMRWPAPWSWPSDMHCLGHGQSNVHGSWRCGHLRNQRSRHWQCFGVPVSNLTPNFSNVSLCMVCMNYAYALAIYQRRCGWCCPEHYQYL